MCETEWGGGRHTRKNESQKEKRETERDKEKSQIEREIASERPIVREKERE